MRTCKTRRDDEDGSGTSQCIAHTEMYQDWRVACWAALSADQVLHRATIATGVVAAGRATRWTAARATSPSSGNPPPPSYRRAH